MIEQVLSGWSIRTELFKARVLIESFEVVIVVETELWTFSMS